MGPNSWEEVAPLARPHGNRAVDSLCVAGSLGDSGAGLGNAAPTSPLVASVSLYCISVLGRVLELEPYALGTDSTGIFQEERKNKENREVIVREG